MRRLYGRISSINVQKVAWALSEINLDFDWVDKKGSDLFCCFSGILI